MLRLALAARIAATALLAVGCYATPPPPALGAELGGCHPGAYGALSELECRRDADCVLCGEPAPARCGRLETRERLMLSNASCPPPDPARCRGAAATCCRGRCVISQGAPPL